MLDVHEYDTGDIALLQKGKPRRPRQLLGREQQPEGASTCRLDLLWSVPLDTAHHWDFEYGVGFGLGVLFGNLDNNWVYSDRERHPGRPVAERQHYAACQRRCSGHAGTPAATRRPTRTPSRREGRRLLGEELGQRRRRADPLPAHRQFPQLGLRYKPVKQFEARLGLGFSLTGFWFGLSGDYGLEKRPDGQTETPDEEGARDPAAARYALSDGRR